MDTEYQLGFKDDWITICRESYPYKSEDILLFALETKTSFRSNRKIEDYIRNLYAIHSGNYDNSSDTLTLLKLLLANGFSVRSFDQNSRIKLIKSFYQIEYVAVSQEREVTIGNYWETTISNPLKQLRSYCKWQDQLTGVKGLSLYLLNQISKGGYQIIARNRDHVNTILDISEK
jgi:hypothetical protein